ncbi:MAG: polysaccharide deacetylase family protein [Terrimicrobiaceae bacterium]|nr:polysaccharide deacetylase family protein [Terrimicrobiaceae bacterium]
MKRGILFRGVCDRRMGEGLRRRFLSGAVWGLATVFVGVGAMQAAEALPNLNEENPKPRFDVTDRTWPASPGEAEICLWKDDKLAALSITIDDNCGPDVEWWLAKAEENQIPLTWFLITGRIGGSNSFDRTWPVWAMVRDSGHAIESHTVMHLHVDKPEWQGIEWEYAHSQKQISEGIPGHAAHFLAYPGGKNSSHNDRQVAAKYYAAARGSIGKINPPNQIDYLGVFAMSAPNLGDGPAWANLQNLFDPANRAYRGWAVLVFHLVKDRAVMDPYFAFFRERHQDLWVGRFGDVAKYGQQRDTVELKVTGNTPDRISFDLRDRMDDRIFDYPLTVKVRVPDAWREVSATQDGKEMPVRIVEHNGGRFALVDAIPDRGGFSLTPAVPKLSSAQP